MNAHPGMLSFKRHRLDLQGIGHEDFADAQGDGLRAFLTAGRSREMPHGLFRQIPAQNVACPALRVWLSRLARPLKGLELPAPKTISRVRHWVNERLPNFSLVCSPVSVRGPPLV
jgi:hypothetical protein